MKRETVIVKTFKTDRSGKRTGPVEDPRDRCRVWPRRSAEGEQGRVVLSGWNVLFPYGDPIPADAVLEVRGQDFQLFGNVADYERKGMLAQCRSVGEQ